MEKKLDKIESKLDSLTGICGEINVTLALQGQDIKYHIERTDILQEQMTTMQSKTIPPLAKHVDRVRYSIKAIAWIVGIASTVTFLAIRFNLF